MITFRNILDALPAYAMLIDSECRIVSANKAVEHKYGANSAKNIIGNFCFKVMHDSVDPIPGCYLKEAVEKGKPIVKNIYDTATHRWMKSEIYPIEQNNGNKESKPLFLHLVHDITDEIRTREDLKHSIDTHDILEDVVRLSIEDLSIREMLQRTLDLIIGIPWLTFEKRGAIFLADNNAQTLILQVSSGLSVKLVQSCSTVPFSKGICGKAARTRKIQFEDGMDKRHNIRFDGIHSHGLYCVPLIHSGKSLGVMNLYVRGGHIRNKDEESFLTAISTMLAGIIIRKKDEETLRESIQTLNKAFSGAVKALSSAVEKRDPYTAGHQERVAQLCVAIAEEMNINKAELLGVRVTGLLHDIGKIAVPAEILTRPGRLSDAEFNIIKTHPQVGYEILNTIEFPYPVAQAVLQHHEHLNGSGYPCGISGNKIILEARILAVADTIETMASNRPYRPGLGLKAALEEIKDKKGSFYDSTVVDACLRLFYEKGYKFDVITPLEKQTHFTEQPM